MTDRILVINPNSNEEVTDAIDRALEPLRRDCTPEITCMTLKDGPFGIETQRDTEVAAELVQQAAKEQETRADAIVIACYSDPGLRALRTATSTPCFGIAESGLNTAARTGKRIGVISILPESVERHWAYARLLGLEDKIAGDLPLNLKVAELADESVVGSKMFETGKRLRDEHGADVIVMGCAGMARYREGLEKALHVPVIDPTQAATAEAIERLGKEKGKTSASL